MENKFARICYMKVILHALLLGSNEIVVKNSSRCTGIQIFLLLNNCLCLAFFKSFLKLQADL